MANLAIIPARGGSKRIPRKNIRPFMGKPIIAYSIQAALNSGLFDEVMVSTDDEEIANIAKGYGASVPFMRSEANANDYATLADVVKEVLDQYIINQIDIENLCCILPTAPLISYLDIKSAYRKMIDFNFTAVYPVVEFSYPIMRSVIIDENDHLKMCWPEYLNTRSQDIKPAYHDCGMFYWIRKESFMQYESMLTPNCSGIIIDEIATQDIDSEQDWKIAELKYMLLHNNI